MKKQSMRVYDMDVATVYGRNEALILQQINYWMQKAKGREINRVKWVYITYAQFCEQFPDMSKSTIQRAVSSLKKQGVIEAKKEFDLIKGSNRTTLHFRVVKMTMASGQNDTKVRSERPLPVVKMTTPYNTDTTTENTKEYIQKRSVPFSGKKEEQKILPKGIKKARYTDGNMSRLFQEAEKWLKEQPEELQEHVGDYLKRAMKDKPIGNQQGYARTIMIDIWKEQTGRGHNTSFRYDAEAIQEAADRFEARMRIGNIF